MSLAGGELSFLHGCTYPAQTACRLTIVPSWFCSWREVDLRSLKGSPDEENEEVMAWAFALRRAHALVGAHTADASGPVGVKCKLIVFLS